MTKHLLLVFTNPVEGREDEFNAWYDKVHLPDVLNVPGFSAAQRFVASPGARGELPAQRYLAVYEVETEDLSAAVAALREATPGMEISSSMAPESVLTYGFSAMNERQSANTESH